jgi:hypothetical protein
MIVYKVQDGNNEIEFLTLEEANSFIAQNNLNATIEQITRVAAPINVLDILEATSVPYIKFGSDLWQVLKQKTWAYNTYLKNQGSPLTSAQLQALLNTSTLIQSCLESGSLLTAKDVLSLLKYNLPQYTVIADYVITEINQFLGI